MNRYLLAIIGLSLIAIYSNRGELSHTFTTAQHTQTQEFDSQAAKNYTTNELKLFLTNKTSMEPDKIASISRLIYAKEALKVPEQQGCQNCEVALKNISEALRDSQKKVVKLEGQIDISSWSKYINILLFILFGSYAAYLNHKKSYCLEDSSHYDRKINIVTFLWALISSVVGLAF